MGSWDTKRSIGDLCDEYGGLVQTGPFGSQLHASDYVEEGIPVVMPVNIGRNTVNPAGIARINESDHERLEKYHLKTGDIVYSRRGDIGRHAYVTPNEDGWLCGTGCLFIRFNNPKIDPRYVSYFLDLPESIDYVYANAVGTTMLNLNTQILRSVPIRLPSFQIQQKIADILGSLDDKIELNRRMNATLEQMAMALYKHWFVDFGPFLNRENEIPMGWCYAPIGNLISGIDAGDWGKESWEDKTPHEVICLRGTDIPQVRTGDEVKAPSRFIKSKSFEKKTLRFGDIVLEGSGGSPTQSTGRSVLITKGVISRFNLPLTCSNFCKIVRPHSTNFSNFMYLLLLDRYLQNEFFMYENGTTGIKNLDTNSFINRNEIAIPPINVIMEFNEKVEGLFEQIQCNAVEIEKLKEIRDYLLPRLLSGEIEVKVAEEQVEEVLADA